MTFHPFYCLLWRFRLIFWTRPSTDEISDEESPLLHHENSTNEQIADLFVYHANGSKLRYRATIDPQLDMNMIHPDIVRELGLPTMCACDRSCPSLANSECAKQATTRFHFDCDGANNKTYMANFAVAPWDSPFDVTIGKQYVRQTHAANVIVFVGARDTTVHMPKESKEARKKRKEREEKDREKRAIETEKHLEEHKQKPRETLIMAKGQAERTAAATAATTTTTITTEQTEQQDESNPPRAQAGGSDTPQQPAQVSSAPPAGVDNSISESPKVSDASEGRQSMVSLPSFDPDAGGNSG